MYRGSEYRDHYWGRAKMSASLKLSPVLLLFESGSHVVQIGLGLTMPTRMASDPLAAPPHLASAMLETEPRA